MEQQLEAARVQTIVRVRRIVRSEQVKNVTEGPPGMFRCGKASATVIIKKGCLYITTSQDIPAWSIVGDAHDIDDIAERCAIEIVNWLTNPVAQF